MPRRNFPGFLKEKENLILIKKNGYELTTGCLFSMGRLSFIDIVARMQRSVIRGFDSMGSRITQASYGLRNIIQFNLCFVNSHD